MSTDSIDITPRLTVAGPDEDGRYRIAVRYGDVGVWIGRREADALIAALQAPQLVAPTEPNDPRRI